MGNTWDFTLWVPDEDFRASARLLLDAARRGGYAPLDAAHPTASVLTDQLAEVEVDTLDELIDLVAREGGSLPLWSQRSSERDRQPDDGVHSGAPDADHDREPDDLLASFSPERQRVSLGCLHELRADRPEDHAKAADLTRIFRLAAESPFVAYGHFTDEWHLEALWQGQDFGDAHRAMWDAIRARRPPPVLFWQTYFRDDYFAKLPASCLAALHHRADATAHGTFLSLAAHPWEAILATRDSSTGEYQLTR